MHPSEALLMDVIDGIAVGEVRQHVAACAQCAARVEEARQGLALARQAEVPEPSPLYWEAFRTQVGRRISVERRSRRVLFAPLAAAAVLAGVIAFLPRGGPAPSAVRAAVTLPAWSPLPDVEDDSSVVLAAALGSRPDELATAFDCRAAEECLAELSDEETQAVVDRLGRELAERP